MAARDLASRDDTFVGMGEPKANPCCSRKTMGIAALHPSYEGRAAIEAVRALRDFQLDGDDVERMPAHVVHAVRRQRRRP